jgi:hypothetical protein
MDETSVQAFWESHPCGDHIVGGRPDAFAGARDFPDFFVEEEAQLYMQAPALPVHGPPGGSRLGGHLWLVLRAGEPRLVEAQ